MIFYGAIFLVAGAFGWGFHRAIIQSRPLSTVVMYVGFGVGAVLLVLGVLVHAFGGWQVRPLGADMTVEVYSKPACPQCTATIKALEKLTSKGCDLDVCKIDVTEDPAAAARVRELGYSSAPVVVAGEDHWSGFRPDRINALVA